MKYTPFVLIAFLVCCNSRTAELDVVNATFMDMIGTHYYNLPPPPPPHKPIHPDSMINEIEGEIELTIELDGEEYQPKDSLTLARTRKMEHDSLLNAYNNFDWEKYRLDSIDYYESEPIKESRNIVLIVNDSLVRPNIDYLGLFENELTPERFKSNFNLDDSWRGLVIELVNQNFEAKSFDIKDLTNVGEYHLQLNNFQPTDQDRIVAELTFSRVIINENGNRACFYYKELCGPLCGYGYLVFAEKIRGKWELKSTRQLWIS